MITYIVTRLITHTIISGFISCIFGSIIGFVVGAIRKQIKTTSFISVLGYFLGSLLVCSFPPVTIPGALETWGVGGGLGSLQVIFMVILIILGGLVSSLISSTFGFKLFLKITNKWLLWILICIYTVMVISLIYSHRQYCSPSISYCYIK